MVLNKRKGYRVERKIRIEFENNGWKVVRAGASLGEADLICIKNKKCILLQIKSTKKKTFYYYDYNQSKLEGFSFYLVVDFGYGRIRVVKPKQRIDMIDGHDLRDFLHKF
jgi:Holliday junction resolvase